MTFELELWSHSLLGMTLGLGSSLPMLQNIFVCRWCQPMHVRHLRCTAKTCYNILRRDQLWQSAKQRTTCMLSQTPTHLLCWTIGGKPGQRVPPLAMPLQYMNPMELPLVLPRRFPTSKRMDSIWFEKEEWPQLDIISLITSFDPRYMLYAMGHSWYF